MQSMYYNGLDVHKKTISYYVKDGRGLTVPVVSKSPQETAAHFGWLEIFVGRDLIGSSVQTQARLGWRPTGPGLIVDLEQMCYSETPADSVSAAPVRASVD